MAQPSIDSFGVSNWTFARFTELANTLGEDRARLTVFSNHFSLATMVRPAWPGCRDMGATEIGALAAGTIALAWASLASGYFAGRSAPGWSSPENARRRLQAEEIATAHGTSATAVALAYVLHQPDNVRAVTAAGSAQHLEELLNAAGLHLTRDELTLLEA